MSVRDRPTCETCRFWRRLDGEEVLDGQGECRRHAPSPTLEIRDDGYGALWPETWDEDWCGEHEPATPAVPSSVREIRTWFDSKGKAAQLMGAPICAAYAGDGPSSDDDMSASGMTLDEAVGSLIRQYPEYFGVEFKAKG